MRLMNSARWVEGRARNAAGFFPASKSANCVSLALHAAANASESVLAESGAAVSCARAAGVARKTTASTKVDMARIEKKETVGIRSGISRYRGWLPDAA